MGEPFRARPACQHPSRACHLRRIPWLPYALLIDASPLSTQGSRPSLPLTQQPINGSTGIFVARCARASVNVLHGSAAERSAEAPPVLIGLRRCRRDVPCVSPECVHCRGACQNGALGPCMPLCMIHMHARDAWVMRPTRFYKNFCLHTQCDTRVSREMGPQHRAGAH
jgi:hypothetical protein